MQRSDSTTESERAPTESRLSKRRRITFRVVLTLFALWVLVLYFFPLLELIFMWFPAETVAEMFDEETSFITLHRARFMAIGAIGWAVVLSTLVQLRKPGRRVAPLLLLVAVAEGLDNATIADRLYISRKTVSNHISNIFTKLHLSDRAQAIVAAREAGLGKRFAPPEQRTD